MNSRKEKLFNNAKKTLLIMGGKQGSHAINTVVFECLPALVKKYNLIHQTGTSSATGDYERGLSLKEALPLQLASSYEVYGYITENEIGKYLKNADLIIARAGAHTIYELALTQKPCLLIPFEHTHMKEQLHNARVLESTGQATILRQADLTPANLEEAIRAKLKEKKAFIATGVPTDATTTILRQALGPSYEAV